MSDIIGSIPARDRTALLPSKQPSWTEPMLATLTEERFSDPAWIFEPKFDGVRCLVFRTPADVRLLSRNRKRLNDHYPELEEAFELQPSDRFVVDGEIVAFEGKRTSFARLQRRMQIADPQRARASGVKVFLYLFDILHADGYDLTGLPLRTRKRALRYALEFRDPLRYSPHRNERGEAYFREACARGWEGLIAERADAPYRHARSGDWLKFKCVNEQEFVIGGYTDPKGSRHGFGALLIGYHRDGELRFAGKVGTGFDDATLERLGRHLARIERERPPFATGPLPRRAVHWVEPELVAQVAFAEWTRDGQLRHPRFRGLRDDKPAREVVREGAT